MKLETLDKGEARMERHRKTEKEAFPFYRHWAKGKESGKETGEKRKEHLKLEG